MNGINVDCNPAKVIRVKRDGLCTRGQWQSATIGWPYHGRKQRTR